MRPLNPREKRTVRFGAIGIAAYLLVYAGFQLWTGCEQKRLEYEQLGREALRLKEVIQLYEDRAAAAMKIMEDYNLDPARLSRTTVVAEASAAIQKAAAAGGVQVGAVRESPSRAEGKELATVQLEAFGPVPAVTAFLHRIERVGYPLIVETVQLTQDPTRPGPLKLHLTVVILNFDKWQKTEEAPHA